ncbi:hypothetical protein SmJEL517_g00186 [Synchytrium microbalum]|uniref:DUF3429 domain-containing protein n=1 Tax=Synchytrium microbalum TaxID=1806994 RepID=A0A507CFN2_9FUNG|nr:uncharacterized protein SmJEL517_g00186 [Synchytrium microbalum]TPX38168.1 hypothetical protein SmJEL517_g00186 [Synchytrium microbalum]
MAALRLTRLAVTTLRQPILKPVSVLSTRRFLVVDNNPSDKKEQTPAAAKYLGYAGLIPYLATTGVGVYMQELGPLLAEVQGQYGACILSFMGAVHWGLAMSNYGNPPSNTSRYILSTAPSLVAFGSLLMTLPEYTLATQLGGFIALLVYDLRARSRGLVNTWYPGLRILLTSVVSVCIGTTLYVKYERGNRQRALDEAQM